jgi:hypothetical protein
MAASGLRDDLDLDRIEAQKFGILDQVIGMAIMAVVVDNAADIVQERRVFEELAGLRV